MRGDHTGAKDPTPTAGAARAAGAGPAEPAGVLPDDALTAGEAPARAHRGAPPGVLAPQLTHSTPVTTALAGCADVTACDINPDAVRNTRLNARRH